MCMHVLINGTSKSKLVSHDHSLSAFVIDRKKF